MAGDSQFNMLLHNEVSHHLNNLEIMQLLDMKKRGYDQMSEQD
jgi:hypothetical protein